MMRFANSFLDEIRDRVPISTVIGQRTTWDRRKTNASRGDWWACCPFHGEKSASFHCEDRKGRYHCFGCGASGDHFRFLTEHDGLSFPEAVQQIAALAGIAMPAADPEAERRQETRAGLQDVMEMAVSFYEAQLHAGDGARARAYLRERGLSASTQQTFRLGYASDSRNALKEFLAQKGVGREQMEACGLLVHGPDVPVSFDRFRDRIMFPIPDWRGKPIAFGGRALSSDAPAKYLNSPETELFHKGNVLFNYARARSALKKTAGVIAVEGYMDVIALAQAGFENIVAPLGTALTQMQLELLWRLSGEPVLCFDGDQAGLKAAWRAAELALPLIQPGRTVRVAILPEGKDPDDLVRQEGPQAFTAVLGEARSLAEFLWIRETAGKVFDTPERRAELEKSLRALASTIQDESVRYHYQQDMRERVHGFFGTARQGAAAKGRFSQHARQTQGGQFSRQGESGRLTISESLARSALIKRGEAMSAREAAILATLINHPTLIDDTFEQVEFLELDSSELKKLHAVVLDALAGEMTVSRDSLLEAIDRAGCRECWTHAIALVRRTRQWPALEDAAIDDARDALLQALHLQRGARILHRELKAAEAALATDPTEENYRHLVEVQAQFRDIESPKALIDGFGVLSGRAGRNL